MTITLTILSISLYLLGALAMCGAWCSQEHPPCNGGNFHYPSHAPALILIWPLLVAILALGALWHREFFCHCERKKEI